MIYDILIVLSLIIFFFLGLKKGIIRSVYSMMSLVISAFLIYFLHDSFVAIVAKSAIGIAIGDFFAGAGGPLLAQTCASAVISIVSVVILYFAVKYVLKAVINAVDFIAKLPVISTINKFLGAVFGLLSGVMWVIIITNVAYCFPDAKPLIHESSIVDFLGILFVNF